MDEYVGLVEETNGRSPLARGEGWQEWKERIITHFDVLIKSREPHRSYENHKPSIQVLSLCLQCARFRAFAVYFTEGLLTERSALPEFSFGMGLMLSDQYAKSRSRCQRIKRKLSRVIDNLYHEKP